jgi:hypothetical protein
MVKQPLARGRMAIRCVSFTVETLAPRDLSPDGATVDLWPEERRSRSAHAKHLAVPVFPT